MTHPDDHISNELREYIDSMKDDERVIETGRSTLQGRQGTIYHNADGVTCIMWDENPNDIPPGKMGTSFTGGARRIVKPLDQEPLSNCCGAPALGEIHEGFAFCRECREMAEFVREEEED